MSHYYPTAPRRVQITPKTSTNITQYLYSRGPVRQVSCCWPISLLDFPRHFRFASHTSVTHSPQLNICEILPLGHKYLGCWIINLLLDVLLCSIAENFDSLYGTTRKNTHRYYTTKRLIRYMYWLQGFTLSKHCKNLLMQALLTSVHVATLLIQLWTFSSDLSWVFSSWLRAKMCVWTFYSEGTRSVILVTYG